MPITVEEIKEYLKKGMYNHNTTSWEIIYGLLDFIASKESEAQKDD